MKESKILRLEEINFEEFNTDLSFGAVVCFVTDTVWGLGCLPECKKGIDKIYEIKGRDRTKPLILMSDNPGNLYRYIESIPPKAQSAIEKFFPGGLTVILKKSDLCSSYVSANKNTVGIRVPDSPLFGLLCKNIKGHVLATTSANKSGEHPVKDFSEAIDKFSGIADYIINNDREKPNGRASTVAEFDSDGFKILRQGDIFLNGL